MSRRVLLLALLLPCLTSCTLLPETQDLPLVEFNCQDALPHNYEVLATLQVAPAKQQYLLAMGITADRINLALLTAQGIPVYDFACSDDNFRVRVQHFAGELPPPRTLLSYLAMIFMDADVVSKQLQPGWTLRAHLAERILVRPNTLAGVQITYQGNAPWFSKIDLTDNLGDLTLHIVILENSRVLPE